jgi:hypothetical protein
MLIFSDPFFALVGAATLLSVSGLFYVLHRRMQSQNRRHIQRNIQQLLLLRALMSGFQRHRGLSNGVLCGDESLIQDLANTGQQLKLLISQAPGDVHQQGWAGLIDHWSRMRAGKAVDPHNNLLQHHLMIRNTIFLMEDVASEVDLTCGRVELQYLPCIWKDVVQAAEWAGQARALGTGIAAAGCSSAQQRVRMRFLYHKIELLSGTSFSTLQRQMKKYPETLSLDLARSQQVVREFLQCIERELLGSESPGIAAKAYFKQATEAIDELLALVDASLNHLQLVH